MTAAEVFQQLGQMGVGAAATVGLYVGVLRSRLSVLEQSVKLLGKDVQRSDRRVRRLSRRIRNLPCQKPRCNTPHDDSADPTHDTPAAA